MCSRLTCFVLFFMLLGSFSCIASQDNENQITIVKDNKSDFTIVVRKDAPENTRFAAKELQTYVEKTSDVLLPIVDDFTGKGKGIFIGPHESLPKEPRFALSSYPDEMYAPREF